MIDSGVLLLADVAVCLFGGAQVGGLRPRRKVAALGAVLANADVVVFAQNHVTCGGPVPPGQSAVHGGVIAAAVGVGVAAAA